MDECHDSVDAFDLARDWPDLLPADERTYSGRVYVGKAAIGPLRHQVAELRSRFEVSDRRTVQSEETPPDPAWSPGAGGAGGPTQVALALAPGEAPPASLVD